jgi:hypothetical protein
VTEIISKEEVFSVAELVKLCLLAIVQGVSLPYPNFYKTHTKPGGNLFEQVRLQAKAFDC